MIRSSPYVTIITAVKVIVDKPFVSAKTLNRQLFYKFKSPNDINLNSSEFCVHRICFAWQGIISARSGYSISYVSYVSPFLFSILLISQILDFLDFLNLLISDIVRSRWSSGFRLFRLAWFHDTLLITVILSRVLGIGIPSR